MNLAPYRKALVAIIGAVVTVLHAFNVPVADDIPVQVIAIYDALTALLVYAVPNEPNRDPLA